MSSDNFQDELNRYFVLWRQCNAMYEDWSKKYSFSCNEILVLNFLYQNNECNQKNISEGLCISKQTVNMILKRFVHEEYVKMTTNDKDKRCKKITLKEKGYLIAKKALDELVDIEINAFKCMGMKRIVDMNDNQEMYMDLFKKYREEIENA